MERMDKFRWGFDIRAWSILDNIKKGGISMKKEKTGNTLRIWMMAIMVTIIIVTGCIEDKEDQGGIIPIVTSEQTPELTTAPQPDTQGIMERYSLEKLISMSDSIVIGTTLDISSKWNTPDGKKPAIDNDNFIYTDIDIKSEEYLKNPLDAGIITVRVLGGTVGQDTSDVEDQPSFNTGEKILIFLKEDADPRTKDIGGKHLVVAGLIQGKIVISENNGVTIGDDKMTLEDVRTKIKG